MDCRYTGSLHKIKVDFFQKWLGIGSPRLRYKSYKIECLNFCQYVLWPPHSPTFILFRDQGSRNNQFIYNRSKLLCCLSSRPNQNNVRYASALHFLSNKRSINYASERSDVLSVYISVFGLARTLGQIAHHQASPAKQGNIRIYE